PHGPPHAWFVGVAPVENPRFAVAVVLENRGYGGAHAAPVAGAMLKAALER
ncbi:MAG: penicillin-binding transpeptidase domain-containing protein, partial [Candidatus Eremiobacterota bacterium]